MSGDVNRRTIPGTVISAASVNSKPARTGFTACSSVAVVVTTRGSLGATRPDQVGTPDGGVPHHFASVRRLDHRVPADVDPDVVDGVPEEHEVAGPEIGQLDAMGLAELVLRRMGELDPGGAPGPHREPRAVEAVRSRPRPLVGLAQLPCGLRHGEAGPGSRRSATDDGWVRRGRRAGG